MTARRPARPSARFRTVARSGIGASGLTALLLVILAVAGPPASASASWSVNLAAGSAGQAAAYGMPAAPTGVTASCTSAGATTVKVSWPAVGRATSYTVYDSTTGIYTALASGLTGTSYTTGSLLPGTYWFEVAAVSGTNWAGPNSTPSVSRTIGLGTCS